MQATDTYEILGLTVSIYADEDCTSPREWDNASVILGSHRNYTIGDGEPEGRQAEAIERGGVRLLSRYLRMCEGAVAFTTVGMLDHSGVTFYAGGGAHNCDPGGWDSGTVGYAYVTRARADELGVDDPEAAMLAELAEYARWAEGDCYGYIITDPDGDTVDSCWGFIGHEYAVEEATATARSLAWDECYVPELPVGETLAALSTAGGTGRGTR